MIMETSLGAFGKIEDEAWEQELTQMGSEDYVFEFHFNMGTITVSRPTPERVSRLLWLCRKHSSSHLYGYHVEMLQMTLRVKDPYRTIWDRPDVQEKEHAYTVEDWLRQQHYNPEVILLPEWSGRCQRCNFPDDLLVHHAYCPLDKDRFSMEMEWWAAGRDAAFRRDPLDPVENDWYHLGYEMAVEQMRSGKKRPEKVICRWKCNVERDSYLYRRLQELIYRGELLIGFARAESANGSHDTGKVAVYVPLDQLDRFDYWIEQIRSR
jgi:hypothetical protein